MPTNDISEKRISTFLMILFFSLWIYFLRGEIFLIPIQGVDSIIRLFDVELFFPKDHWPPLPQLYLQLVSTISDTALSYKIASTIVALIAMYSIFRLVEELFGIASASFTTIFFFLNLGWIFIATNPYPETFMILFLAQTLHALLRRQHSKASLFFALACLSRLEALFFFPFLLYKLKASQASPRAYITLSAFIIPLICFFATKAYVSTSSELHSVDISSFGTSIELLKALFGKFLEESEWIFLGAVALIGTLSLIFARNSPYRSGTALAVVSLTTFFLCYIFITPLFHSYLPTGTSRKTMLVLLPLCIFASSLFFWTPQREQRVISILILLTLAIFSYQSDRNIKLKGFTTSPESITPWVKQLVSDKKIEICIPYKYDSPVENYFSILNEDMKRDIYLQLRFNGLSIRKRSCHWKNTVPSKDTLPLLLVLGKHEAPYQQIKINCKNQTRVSLQEKEIGIACML